jgi:hypothetical protein
MSQRFRIRELNQASFIVAIPARLAAGMTLGAVLHLHPVRYS